MEAGGQSHAPAALPREKTRTGDWVDLMAGLDACEISWPNRESISGPSSS